MAQYQSSFSAPGGHFNLTFTHSSTTTHHWSILYQKWDFGMGGCWTERTATVKTLKWQKKAFTYSTAADTNKTLSCPSKLPTKFPCATSNTTDHGWISVYPENPRIKKTRHWLLLWVLFHIFPTTIQLCFPSTFPFCEVHIGYRYTRGQGSCPGGPHQGAGLDSAVKFNKDNCVTLLLQQDNSMHHHSLELCWLGIWWRTCWTQASNASYGNENKVNKIIRET